MEEKATDEMEMAAQANEERKKVEKTAQGWIKRYFVLIFFII